MRTRAGGFLVKGNDKGAVEGMVGYARRNHMVPIPHFASWDDFNADLEGQCRARLTRILRGHKETIGERLQRDLVAMRPLPAAPFDACDQERHRDATGLFGYTRAIPPQSSSGATRRERTASSMP